MIGAYTNLIIVGVFIWPQLSHENKTIDKEEGKAEWAT
jgi:hypothetical protein